MYKLSPKMSLCLPSTEAFAKGKGTEEAMYSSSNESKREHEAFFTAIK
ncbi:unnamed protein product, partial [Brassica rapa subsp. narinosa]